MRGAPKLRVPMRLSKRFERGFWKNCRKRGDLDFDQNCGKCLMRVPTRNLCKLETETDKDFDDGVQGLRKGFRAGFQ